MGGEGTPESLAPLRRHGLDEAGAVELPLQIQRHDQTAGFREAHLGGHGVEERVVDVAGSADEIRLADLQADRVRAPVGRGSGDVRLILGQEAGVAGMGQPHHVDPVRDVPPGGAVHDGPADVEGTALVLAGRRLGRRRRSSHAQRHRATDGDDAGDDGGYDDPTSHAIPPDGSWLMKLTPYGHGDKALQRGQCTSRPREASQKPAGWTRPRAGSAWSAGASRPAAPASPRS